jgi:hypothetical protein
VQLSQVEKDPLGIHDRVIGLTMPIYDGKSSEPIGMVGGHFTT